MLGSRGGLRRAPENAGGQSNNGAVARQSRIGLPAFPGELEEAGLAPSRRSPKAGPTATRHAGRRARLCCGSIWAGAPITQKIGAIAELSDRFDREVMPDVRAAVDAEFQRHAAGQSIVEHSSELSERAAKFQKFIQSHTPESLRTKLESLPVVDAGSALYSSPAPEENPKYDVSKVKSAVTFASDTVAATPLEKLRSIGKEWLAIGSRDDTHKLGKNLTATTIPNLLKQLPEGMTGLSVKDLGMILYPEAGLSRTWEITTPQGKARIMAKHGEVWVDTSAIGDPASYSDPTKRPA